jgi:lipoprotein LprG
MSAKLAVIAYIAVTAAVLTAGCSTGARRSGEDSSADSQAEALVHSCAETTRKLVSAHLVIDVKGKFGHVGPVAHVDADVQTNPVMANGQAIYQNGTATPFVLADNVVSVKLGSEWSELGETSTFIPPNIIDPSQGMRTILDSITSLRLAGTETINGVETRKVTGIVPAARLKQILPDATNRADFTAWIQASGGAALVRTAINASAQQSLTVTLSNWNMPVSLTRVPTA